MSLLLQIPSDANSIQGWMSIGQLLLSVATIVLLLSTFKLQAETFKKQAEATQHQADATKLQAEATKLQADAINLQREEFIYTIFPTVSISREVQGNSVVSGLFRVKAINNVATVYRIVFESDRKITFPDADFSEDVNYKMNAGHGFAFKYNVDTEGMNMIERLAIAKEIRVKFYLYYKDMMGTQYMQLFSGKLSRGELYAHAPDRI